DRCRRLPFQERLPGPPQSVGAGPGETGGIRQIPRQGIRQEASQLHTTEPILMQKVITNASDLASVLLGGAEVKFVNDKLIVVELSREQAEQERRRAEQAKYVAAEDFANA